MGKLGMWAAVRALPPVKEIKPVITMVGGKIVYDAACKETSSLTGR